MIRTALPTALLAGVVAIAGCGGSGGNDSSKPPAPVSQAPSNAGGVVTAEGTQGLIGPAGRASAKKLDFDDTERLIPRNANRRPKNANGVAGGEACPDTGIMPSEENMAQINAAIICLVNGERAAAGLPALQQNGQLDQAAAGMAKRIVTEHFFAHETPDGKTVVDRVEPTGYIPRSGDWVVGENLAWGSGGLSTPQAIVNGWMNSPGHKANILAPDYKDIGLAAAMGSPKPDGAGGGTVYVNNFGAKSGADASISLPGKAGDSNSGAGDGESAVAGTKASAAAKKKARAKAKHKAKHKAKKKAKRKKRKRRS